MVNTVIITTTITTIATRSSKVALQLQSQAIESANTRLSKL